MRTLPLVVAASTLSIFFLPLSPAPTAPAAAFGGAPGATWSDVGGSLAGPGGTPSLSAEGSLTPGGAFELALDGASANAAAFLFIGFSNASLPFFGGTLVPSLDTPVLPFVTDGNGESLLAANWPATSPPGVDVFFQYWVVDGVAPLAVSASNAIQGLTADGPEPGGFPDEWIWGEDCATETKVQVHRYNPDFYILRQSVCTDFEAPFLYLLFGPEQALLIDTGAGDAPIQLVVNRIVDEWAAARGIQDLPLVVAHTHSHGDHFQGDADFVGQPNTSVAPTSLTGMQQFWGFQTWPDEVLELDLGGGRIVDLLGIPGHEPAHLAFYDRRTAVLVTGDSLYPGRCYVFNAASQGNWAVFKDSFKRLVAFTNDKPLEHVLGTHIEMTATPGVDFPLGAPVHPDEHELRLGREHLLQMDAELDALGDTPQMKVLDDFIIFPIN